MTDGGPEPVVLVESSDYDIDGISVSAKGLVLSCSREIDLPGCGYDHTEYFARLVKWSAVERALTEYRELLAAWTKEHVLRRET